MRKAVLALALTTVVLAFAATATGEPAAPAAIPGCAKDSLNLLNAGLLTLATDNPAFDPWWAGGSKSKDWELNDPTTGKGYESAVAYQIAKRLGFARAQVTWKAVPFLKSFAPGKKPFDWYMAQVSAYPERRKVATFSGSYYNVNQAVAGLKTNPIAKVRSLAGLKRFKLGASIGTTSYAYITKYIKPSQQPAVYDTVNDAVTALKNKQIDGLVHDFPSMGYITAVQVPGSTVVGRLPNQGGVQEYFGLVFQKGNKLVSCVNKAIKAMRTDGTLKRLEVRWLGQKGAPILK
jgi:polar amino acid transport system substrate-binding protein